MNNELYHYGVLGMKWGQKRSAKKLEKIEKRSKKEGWSKEATEAAKIKTKSTSQMTNAELNQLNTRQQLERTHSQLSPNVIKKGLAYATAATAAMGTILALKKTGGQFIKEGAAFVAKAGSKIASASMAAAIAVGSRR